MLWLFRRHVRGRRGAYVIVSPREWGDDHDRPFWLHGYEVLDLFEARVALADIARTPEGPELLRNVAREILPYSHLVRVAADPYERTQQHVRRVEELRRALGSFTGEGERPPRFARFYICRRTRPVQVPQLPPDPWKEVAKAIEAAKAAPRGYVTIEVLTEEEKPVPSVRLEVLLADGEVISRATDADGRLHVEPIPQGRCTVRVTTLDGTAWRPGTGSASRVDQRHTRTHVVRHGERLGHIARQHGFYDWQKLWSAPENAALREKRREPQWLRPGDEIVIPSIQVHQVVWPTDQAHRIVVRERPDEASVFVVTPYTRVDLEQGVEAEFTLVGPRYSQKLALSAHHTPVADHFEVHFIELEFKGVPTDDRYVLKIKPDGGEECTVLEDVPFEELVSDTQLDGGLERSRESAG